jgi:monofunctional biosynthetic peptidoglycan transglycosylase
MARARKRNHGRVGRVFRRLAWIALALVATTVLQVAVLRFVDPPFSAFMAARQLEAWMEGDRGFRVAYDWRDLDAVSAHLPVAVVAAEDQRFADHAGFDFEAIERARADHARGKRLRGASTISQQVAKNLFLWSGGGWVRKGIEAWYTVLLEALWPKRRILEVYVNVAEFGDGVYGAQAAARTWFGRDAAALEPWQAARLAAVLPSPRRYSVAAPGPYVRGRTASIQRQMGLIGGTAWLDRLDAPGPGR